MKNKLLGLIAMAIIAIAIIGCKGDEPEPTPQDLPKDQTATINPFEDLQLTVKGYFTNAEWAGVAGKIEAAISGDFSVCPEVARPTLKSKYAKCEAIIVEKTTEYTKWKTNGNGKTMYINFDILNDVNLSSIISAAMMSMDGNKAETNDTQPKQHDSFHGVEVWSEVGVSDDQVTTIIGYLTAISGGFFPEEEVKFALLTQIRVKSGTGISKDGTVLNIGADETPWNIGNYIFASVVN